MATKTKSNIKEEFVMPKNCTSFEDLLIREYGIPGSLGRDLFEIDHVKFLKRELRNEKDPVIKEIYKKRIAYYSKKHGLKI